MCGRFTHLFTWKQLYELLALHGIECAIPARYNVAPTQTAPVVVADDETGFNVLRQLQWGLVPSWADDPKIGSSLINARGESVATKPAFRSAFKHRRCIVPISGFYEWKPIPGSKFKQPLYITPTDVGDIWLLAGLWESWKQREGSSLDTFTILTTAANQAMAKIHDRMPVILERADALRWLDHTPSAVESSTNIASSLITQYPAERMLFTPVSRLVNAPRNDSPDCIKTDIESSAPQADLFG
ncbi:MAG: SOS response-associated peptidase [Planctomycetes bacterium]|nr:SOS response-associated peptidase [Planctomycetota bacterium]